MTREGGAGAPRAPLAEGTSADDPRHLSPPLDAVAREPSVVEGRWEHGSHLGLSHEVGTGAYPWDALPHRYLGSGREALRALLAWGRDARGWRALAVPSYFCQQTLAAVVGALPIRSYEWAPTDRSTRPVSAGPGEAVLSVHAFGLQPRLEVEPGVAIIEDHTHDPASPRARASRADYAVASLRKAYPLPDGGVAWSPRGLDLPEQPAMAPGHAETVLMRLSAMALQRLYLAGADVSRDSIRSLFTESESAFGRGSTSGISSYSRLRLATLPARRWRRVRAANVAAFRAALGRPPGVRLLSGANAAVLVLERAAIRDHLRAELIRQRVYPATIWPLDEARVAEIPEEHLDLSRRLLVLHADQRYSPADMRRVADLVREALGWR